MIAVDTQLLVYAHRVESPWHERARDCIAELAGSGVKWAIPMHCLVELYAKVTHRRLFRPPSSSAQAIAQIDAWLECPTVEVLSEDARTWLTARDLLARAAVAGDHAYDARIAAVCIQHGVTELWTHDRYFLDFPMLRVRNPLIDIQPSGAREPSARYVTTPRTAAAARPRPPARGAARRR